MLFLEGKDIVLITPSMELDNLDIGGQVLQRLLELQQRNICSIMIPQYMMMYFLRQLRVASDVLKIKTKR